MSGQIDHAQTRASTEPLAVRVPEACRMIGIGRSKLYELIAEGTIKAVKIGSVTVIPIAQLKALIER